MYTQPIPRTFLAYKRLNLVRILFFLQHVLHQNVYFYYHCKKKKKPSIVQLLDKFNCIHSSYFIFDRINLQKLYFDSINWVKSCTSVKINWVDILFEASDDTDIMLASYNSWRSYFSANRANTSTTITSLSVHAQENLELKMSEINFEQSFGLNES